MSGKKFKSGDVVTLKSGGPRMVVDGFKEDFNQYACKWFVKDQVVYGKFGEDTLEADE